MCNVMCWSDCVGLPCTTLRVHHTACYHCVLSLRVVTACPLWLVAAADGKHEEEEKPVVMPGEVVQFEVGMEELESLGTLNKKVSACVCVWMCSGVCRVVRV